MNIVSVETFIKKISISQIFYIALAIRILALIIVPNPLLPDAGTYHAAGAAIFNGTHFSYKIMPLYPILAYLFANEWVLKLFDCLLSALTAVLIYKISLALFEKKTAATLSAMAAAIYPYFIFYSITGLTESSFLFLLCLSFYLFYKKQYFWACVVSVVALLIRPVNDLLNPLLILLFVLLIHRENWKTALKYLLIYGVIYSVLLAPWWALNYHRYHQFVRLNLGFGLVAYLGNNPMNKSGGGIGGVDGDTKNFDAIKNPVARNQALLVYAKNYAFSHPWRTIKLDGTKFLRFWRLYPYAPQYRNTSSVIISLLSYGVMLALCLIYLFRHLKRDWKKISPMLLLTLYLTVGCMISVASIRYRLPIEPFILILGCKTLDEFIQWLGKKPIEPLTQST